MNLVYQPVILNAFTGAGDITASAGYLSIAGVNPVYYPNGSAQLLKSQLPTVSLYTLTAAAANSTVYAFTIVQQSLTTGNNVSFPVYYTSLSADTDANIATQLTAEINKQLNANGGGLYASVSGAAISTGLTIVGLSANPVIAIQGSSSNITVTNNLSVANVSSTNATPIVMTTAASTYSVGQVVVISGHTVNTAANGTWRVRATNGTTTVTLEHLDGSDSVGNGVGGATGTTAKRASAGMGTYAQVAAIDGSQAGAIGTPISPDTYTTLTFDGFAKMPSVLTAQSRAEFVQTVYMDEAGANYAAMLVSLRNQLKGYDAGGTVANPALIAVAP